MQRRIRTEMWRRLVGTEGWGWGGGIGGGDAMHTVAMRRSDSDSDIPTHPSPDSAGRRRLWFGLERQWMH